METKYFERFGESLAFPLSLPSVVYQGTLSTTGGHYDLREIIRALVGEGLSLDVYPSRSVPAYAEFAAALPGLRVHATLQPSRLLAALPQFDFGWAGLNSDLNGAHLDTCLPNKVTSTSAAACPCLRWGTACPRGWLATTGWA